MEQNPKIIQEICRLWRHLTLPRRLQLVACFFLMLLAALSEFISLGAVVPFLAILISPDKLLNQSYVAPLLGFFEYTSHGQILLLLTILFCCLVLLSAMIRLLLLWGVTKVSHGVGFDIGTKIYEKTLYKPYQLHVQKNSSELIVAITAKVGSTIGVVLNVLNLLSAVCILLSILTVMLIVNASSVIFVFGVFGLIYLCVNFFTSRKILNDGKTISKETAELVRLLQDSFGGVRDILTDSTQSFFLNLYKQIDSSLRLAQARLAFFGQGPRYLIEAGGIITLVIFAYFASEGGAKFDVLFPLLGVLALAAQRVLPAIQQVYSSWVYLLWGSASLKDTIALLEESVNTVYSTHKIDFNNQLLLENVSFKYDVNATQFVLRDINLLIMRGQKIGVVGTTGGGKSTLIDILMGLLSPSVGVFKVDDEVVTQENCAAWQKNIAHVPQAIFLSANSIAENIAFGCPESDIDYQLVRRVSQCAQLDDFVMSLPHKYNTKVGERGVMLSGGQRQRIGLARALYKGADVLFLDEATSALDLDTEMAVMNSICELSKNMTVFIVAHRIQTLSMCDQIIEIDSGRIKATSSC